MAIQLDNLNQYVANHHLFFAYFHLKSKLFLKLINHNLRLIPSGETIIRNLDIHGSLSSNILEIDCWKM